MQQCTKSDISSTRGNRAVVPACTGTGTRVYWSGGGMTRMLSVIVAATLAMFAAVGVGRCV